MKTDNTNTIVEIHDKLSELRKEIFSVKDDLKFTSSKEYRIKFVDLLSEKRKLQKTLDYLLATYNNEKEVKK